jgi:hypothetical protein
MYVGCVTSVTNAVDPVLKVGVVAKCSVLDVDAVVALVVPLTPAYAVVVRLAQL